MGKIAPGTASRTTIDPRRLAVKDAATRARAAGISVCPPAENGTKMPRPAIPDAENEFVWKPLQLAPADDALFARWYGNHTGIGWICGGVSGGLECFEFDDAPTYHRFRELAHETGDSELVERVEAGYKETSAGEGIHWCYFCDELRGNTELARRPNPTEANPHKVDVLIETRGEGGFIVVAPSFGGVHASGRPYVLDRGGVESIVTLTSAERNTLWNLARLFDEMPIPAAEPIESEPKNRSSSSESRPGDDYAKNHSWAQVLGKAFTPVYEQGGKTFWKRAGKDKGVSATTNHGGSDLLYVFSSSTVFEPKKSYTKFGAYARLHHQGDYSAAARELRRLNYGAGTNGSSHHSDSDPKGTKDASRGGKADDEADYQNDIIDRRPKIDPAAFHGIAGEIVRLADPHTEADPIAVLVQFLVGFANALGRGPYWITSATHHYMVLFVVLVGSTASGRKGTAWDIASFFLAHLDPTWAKERVTQGLSTGEGLIHHVRDPVYVTEDGEQKCVDPGVDDKRLLPVETELGRVFKSMGRQGNTLSGVARQVWDCRETLSTLTKNNPTRATGAHVSIIGHITSDELRLLLNDTETANGFGNRFLWICSRRSKSLPDGGAFFKVDWTPILERLRAIHETARHVRFMRRDDEARDIWHAVYPDLTAGQPGLLGMMLARAEPMVMRLACVYALLDGESIVRAEHMEAALALWQYAEMSTRYIFGESLGDAKAQKVMDALRAAPEGLKRSQIMIDVFARHIQKVELDQVLTDLVELGLIHCRPGVAATGRPPQLWFAGRLPSDAK